VVGRAYCGLHRTKDRHRRGGRRPAVWARLSHGAGLGPEQKALLDSPGNLGHTLQFRARVDPGTAFGVAAAVFLAEGFVAEYVFALLKIFKLQFHPVWGKLPEQVDNVLRNLIELLAAIPSVVYGLWGLFVVMVASVPEAINPPGLTVPVQPKIRPWFRLQSVCALHRRPGNVREEAEFRRGSDCFVPSFRAA